MILMLRGNLGYQISCALFLPPTLTSHIQPADMGIIAVLKAGYKLFMVRRLLVVYENQIFRGIYIAHKIQKREYKGLEFGGKAHVLNGAEILNQIWSIDEKYANKLPFRTSLKIWYLERFGC